jgi:hypothetical protein
MKNVLYLCLVMLVIFAVVKISDVHAQSASGIILLNPASSAATCAWPSGATVTNGMGLCPLNLSGQPGLAIALNGNTTFTQVFPAVAQAGVASFNGRTGNVTLTDADVVATGVKATTTATTSLQ